LLENMTKEKSLEDYFFELYEIHGGNDLWKIFWQSLKRN
jgi:hypothetical protein